MSPIFFTTAAVVLLALAMPAKSERGTTEPCTVQHDCGNDATAVSGDRATGCHCTCNTGFTGERCHTCAANYGPYWPFCDPLSCTMADDCSGHASAVSGERPTGCTCTCAVGFTGAACNVCAVGYEGYPNCVPSATTTVASSTTVAMTTTTTVAPSTAAASATTSPVVTTAAPTTPHVVPTTADPTAPVATVVTTSIIPGPTGGVDPSSAAMAESTSAGALTMGRVATSTTAVATTATVPLTASPSSISTAAPSTTTTVAPGAPIQTGQLSASAPSSESSSQKDDDQESEPGILGQKESNAGVAANTSCIWYDWSTWSTWCWIVFIICMVALYGLLHGVGYLVARRYLGKDRAEESRSTDVAVKAQCGAVLQAIEEGGACEDQEYYCEVDVDLRAADKVCFNPAEDEDRDEQQEGKSTPWMLSSLGSATYSNRTISVGNLSLGGLSGLGDRQQKDSTCLASENPLGALPRVQDNQIAAAVATVCDCYSNIPETQSVGSSSSSCTSEIDSSDTFPQAVQQEEAIFVSDIDEANDI